jgi:hypothetical protein
MFINKYLMVYSILFDKKICNVKYKISKYFTNVFSVLLTKKHIKNKYYHCIKRLLLDKFILINNQLKKN